MSDKQLAQALKLKFGMTIDADNQDVFDRVETVLGANEKYHKMFDDMDSEADDAVEM